MSPRSRFLMVIVIAAAALGSWYVLDGRSSLSRSSVAMEASIDEARDSAADKAGADADVVADASRVPAADAASAAGSATPQAIDAPKGSRFHPRQMSADSQRRVDQFIATLTGTRSPTASYVKEVSARLANEKPDAAWGRDIQTVLDDGYASHASLVHNLEVASAQCAVTVCAFTAVAPVENPQAPGTDWQRFIYDAFSDPQWRDQVGGMSTTTSVSTVDGHTVYVTYFERK